MQVQAGSGYDRFIDLMAQEFRVHEKDLRRAGVQLRYTSQPFVMRLGIKDQDEAAFSFDHSAKTEIAFRTRDANLLKDFCMTCDEQW